MAETANSAETAPKGTDDQMYELLDATEGNVIALRMYDGTRAGYHELYRLLVLLQA